MTVEGFPLPAGEGDRVRVHEPERLRPLTQDAVERGVFPAPFGAARRMHGLGWTSVKTELTECHDISPS